MQRFSSSPIRYVDRLSRTAQLLQLKLTIGFCRAKNSLRRQCRRQIDRLDDCVVNRIPALHAVRFSNEAEGAANLLLEDPVAIWAID